ncbi:MAG TPA: NADH-quinone oxidoreductase subunit A [Verrucomicrobiae bacterium]|nr:NADH-quinone oxidoreductase subunit A [Verrucomicrobiae bacterium]
MAEQLQQYVPVGLLLLVAIGFATATLLAPLIIGKPRVHNPVKDSPYECGLPPMTDAHTRFSVKFYLIAMLFIVFDIEVVFMLGWAAVFRDMIKPVAAGGIGIKMLLGALLFLGILEVGHVYAWKKGALDWAPRKEHLPEPKPAAPHAGKKAEMVAR